MRGPISLILVCVVIVLVHCDNNGNGQQPFWIVLNQNTPIYRGRLDPIVQPGVTSNHAHKVFGGSAFQNFPAGTSNISMYNSMYASSCTTSSITIDKSAYWVPDLYYRYPDGNLTLVPVGGLKIYYQARTGSAATTTWTAFPPGFRMTAGNPFRRSTTGSIAESGMTFACLASTPTQEVSYFPTIDEFCVNGLRGQVYFPSCWDGVNLDSPNHQSHVAYPLTNYDNGDCPAGFPKRFMGLFYEILWSVDKFPHGNGRQPFVLAPGDPTGYGMHGDFLNGWNTAIFQSAINDASCIASNTNNGNTPENCLPFKPYVKSSNPDQSCLQTTAVYNYEDLGYGKNISHLPGCDDITPIDVTNKAAIIAGTSAATPKTGSTKASSSATAQRVLIKSSNGNFWTSQSMFVNITSTIAGLSTMTYHGTFVLNQVSPGVWSILSEYNGMYVTAQQATYPLIANKNSPSTWETFAFNYISSTGPTAAGTTASIKAFTNNQYLSLVGNVVYASATTVTSASTFTIYDADATLPNPSGCV